MNDNELKKLWQQQPLRDPAISPAQVMSAMQAKTTQLRRTLLARDVRELSACVFVGVIFGIYFFINRAPVARLGALITVAGSIFIAWKILHARRTTPAAKPDATVVESLRAELHSVRTQSQLLRSVGWWYLLPLAVGTLVFVWGMPFRNLVFDLVFRIGFTLVELALNVFIYRLNQRAVSKQLLPVERQLESLLRSAETGEPPDESHVANLRPIVLSMQVAEHVKPVEFKVAFWQLAVFGVPGIVGIWFFLIIGLTMSDSDSKVNERVVEPPPQSVRAEETSETNRYSVVARKVVDLFNAGDYGAVQKLYNAEMSKVFPPKETSDFYTRLATQLGKIETFEGPTTNGYRGWTAFRLHYQHGEITMSLALDADNRISGIYFKPAPTHYAIIKNIKPFMLRLFSWQHLLGFVPFFLGGLLYSWLIQKTTKRAVGISTLGIHLCKGQTLILWDEIKEVRPFRFLHIRNLWLIQESGEKTRMHWTPLERHSELKAAVEKFAPANHPMRKFLSLLRPESSRKNIMTKTILIGIVLISLGAIVFVHGSDPKPPAIEYSDPISQLLESIRVKHSFPALAAAVVVDGKIVVTSAVGFRKSGGPEKVMVDDQFHLGSVTKSMTATVAAMLVEQGKISWTTTIGETFPELKSEIHPDYLGVTLEQLLSHRSGAPGDAPADLWRDAWAATGTAAEQRLAFIKGILAREPEAKPGTKFTYSNQGYTIAGVMLEKATGKTWEDLLRSMLFEPLGMTTAGFGAPASIGKVDQPWGHTKAASSGIEAVPPGPRADNPLAISPAGAVHCSVGDLAKYAAFHMVGERGESKLLKAESFKKLHTIAAGNDDYALGWMVLKRPWANGRALMHNGSNTMFYVVVWMAPEKNCAVVVASNIGVDEAFAGCDEAAGKLINQYFGE
jgi:CubicO group peptidase (beta-lactamase class C family)